MVMINTDKLSQDKMAELIVIVTAEIRDLLLMKNNAYGNSVADPVRIFSKADVLEQINVRIDDKISRLVRGLDAGEDVELDLIGYLVLKRAVKRFRETENGK